MSEIQDINLNKVEVKLADTDDPVASRVSWEPAKSGGASFKAQKMTEGENKIIVEKSMGAIIFAIPGLLAVVVGSPYLFLMDQFSVGFLCFSGELSLEVQVL